MNLGEIYTKFRLDTGDFTANISNVTSGLKNVETTAKASTQPINTLGSSIQSMALKAAAALGLYKLVDGIKSTIVESTMLSARVETLGVVMATVGKNVGLNAVQMENYAKNVAAMGITTQVSRETVIRMVQAQMDLTDATKLARIAQDAAVIGNTNSSDALQKMIYGIQVAEVQVLKTIGLNVNFENSYKKFGAQINKNAEDLNELDKIQARTNAVMEAGSRIAGTYEAAMGTVGKQINTLPRFIEEAKLKFGELFKPALIVIVSELTKGLQDLNIFFEKANKSGDAKQWTETIKVYMQGAVGAGLALLDTVSAINKLMSKKEPETAMEAQNRLSEEYLKNKKEILHFERLFAEEGTAWYGKASIFGWDLYAQDRKRLEILKERNAAILVEFKAIGDIGKKEITTNEEVIETAKAKYKTIVELTSAQRTLQTTLTADILKLKDKEFGAFAAEYAKREKIVGKDAEGIKLLNEWAALESEKIWKETNNKIFKSYENLLEMEGDAWNAFSVESFEQYKERNDALLQDDIKLLDAMYKNKMGLVEKEGDAWEALYVETAEQSKERLDNEKKLSIERITLEAGLYADLKGYGNEYYEAQKKLIAQRIKDLKQAGVDEKAILAWSIEENFKADQKKLLSSDNFFDGLKAGYRQNIKDQKTWAEEGEGLYKDYTNRKKQFSNEFVDNFIAGQNLMLSIQKAAGNMAVGLAGDISKKMWAAAIEKIIGMIGAHIGGGAALVAWQGANKGGVAGALAEIGIFLGSGVAAMLAGRAMAQKFKAEGGWVGAHPDGGWVREGSGNKDDVFLGYTPGTRHWGMGGEFVVNKESSQKHAPLLEAINRDRAWDEGGSIDKDAWKPVSQGLGIGCGASFLHGFLTKGGFWGGISEAIAFNATAIPSMFAGKYLSNQFKADGGRIDVGHGWGDFLHTITSPFHAVTSALSSVFNATIGNLPGLGQYIPNPFVLGQIMTDPKEAERVLREMIQQPYEQVAKDIMTPGKYYSDPIDVVTNNIKNLGKVWETFTGAKLPGFRAGIDYVPQTGPAMLHQGERVISKEDNVKGGQLTINIPVILNGREIGKVIYDETKRGNKMIHSRGMAG